MLAAIIAMLAISAFSFNFLRTNKTAITKTKIIMKKVDVKLNGINVDLISKPPKI
jgi:hypothetical protein